MDTLRATSLSTILTGSNEHNKQSKNNTTVTTNGNNSSMKLIHKDNVSKLVKVFGELSKHEKILFLINIREFTREQQQQNQQNSNQEQSNKGLVNGNNNGASQICNGTSPSTTTSEPSTSSSTSTPPNSIISSSTPQSLRLSRTSNWLQKTFIQDTQVALPKEEVYSLYKHEFLRLNEKPISTADFGKLMRQVFPDVKARRLGQRGQSKYCYAIIRKRSEVEKPALPNPLPQNELISWAKNKFNIDFGEVGQVVAFLKCEERNNVVSSNQRKRRASYGGAGVGKQNKSGSKAVRSASVSVLEQKDDPLVLLHDNESLEIGSYFENSNNSTGNWPQLRSLLTDESNSCGSSSFGPFSTGSLLHNTNSKKKRHSSSVQFEFIKPESNHGVMLNRSQSVPVTEMSFIRGGVVGIDAAAAEMRLFDEFGGSGALVLDGVGSGGSNPLFSSAVTGGLGSNKSGSSSSSTSTSSMFESLSNNQNDGGGNGNGGLIGNGSSSSIVDVNIDNNSLLIGSSGGTANGGGGNGSSGNDVFFDSVFDLMMSDCQNKAGFLVCKL